MQIVHNLSKITVKCFKLYYAQKKRLCTEKRCSVGKLACQSGGPVFPCIGCGENICSRGSASQLCCVQVSGCMPVKWKIVCGKYSIHSYSALALIHGMCWHFSLPGTELVMVNFASPVLLMVETGLYCTLESGQCTNSRTFESIVGIFISAESDDLV